MAVEMDPIQRRDAGRGLQVESEHLQFIGELEIALAQGLGFGVGARESPGQRLCRDHHQRRCHQNNGWRLFGPPVRAAVEGGAGVVNQDAGAVCNLFCGQVEIVLAVIAAQRQDHHVDGFVAVQGRHQA